LSKTNGDVVFYYRTKSKSDVSELKEVRFAVDLTDGGRYQVLLTVGEQSNTVSLRVDDVLIGGTRSLGGTLADCGVPTEECQLYLGQRASSSGNYMFAGIMYDARLLDGVAATVYPRVV
jgi:hypothetical protein